MRFSEIARHCLWNLVNLKQNFKDKLNNLLESKIIELSASWAKIKKIEETAKSKYVWPGNATITHYRPAHATVRKGQRTITATWHSEDNRSKATNSLKILYVQIILCVLELQYMWKLIKTDKKSSFLQEIPWYELMWWQSLLNTRDMRIYIFHFY